MTLKELREHLDEIDAPVGGRVEVFDAAHDVAGRVLQYLGIHTGDEGQTLAAVNVLVSVAGDVLRYLHELHGLPVGHVLPDLKRTRDLVIRLGCLDGALAKPEGSTATATGRDLPA